MAERTPQTSPRSIPEQNLSKEVGGRVELPDGTSYVISGVYGKAQLIHTAEGTGRWFVGWHDSSNLAMVVIHGGEEGMPSLYVVRRQLVHIVNGYQGVKVRIDRRLWEEEERVGRETYQDLSQNLERNVRRRREITTPDEYEIPGEQQVVVGWINQLQHLSLELPKIRTSGDLKRISDQAEKVVRPLSFVTNQYKRAAYDMLQTAMDSGDRAHLLRAVMESQVQLLQRSQEIVWKSIGVMNRLNDIDIFQKRWNETVYSLPLTLSHMARVMESDYPEDRRANAMRFFLHTGQTGLWDKLQQMTGEPYFSQAQSFVRALSPVAQHWERQNLAQIKRLVGKQVERANVWKGEIEDQEKGYQFGRFEIASA